MSGRVVEFGEHVRAATRARHACSGRSTDRGYGRASAAAATAAATTVAALETAGLRIEQTRSFDLGPGWLHTNPHVLGVARAP